MSDPPLAPGTRSGDGQWIWDGAQWVSMMAELPEPDFRFLEELICEEWEASVGIGRDMSSPDGRMMVASLMADHILDGFELKRRGHWRERYAGRHGTGDQPGPKADNAGETAGP